MKVIVEGHTYGLESTKDFKGLQIIRFVEKVKNLDGKLETVNDGTTVEEVLRACIDRLANITYHYEMRGHYQATIKLQEALLWLESDNKIIEEVEGEQNVH